MRNSVVSADLERAERAAALLRQQLGISGQEPWLVALCGAIDGCGRPYVHVSVSQWRSSGGNPRFSAAPDGEVPVIPEWVGGLPVFKTVRGCFGERAPGCSGTPCVPEAEPGVGLGALGQGSASADPEEDPMNSPLAAALSLAAGSGIIIGMTALVFRFQGWSTKFGRARDVAESQPWIERQRREEGSGPGIWN